MKIRFLKFLDNTIGRLLVALTMPPRAHAIDSIRSALLIRPGGIGDALLLADCLASLRQKFPDVTIDILAEKRNADAFELLPGLRDIFIYDHPAGLVSIFRRRYDVVIDTEQWHRLSAFIGRMVYSKLKIGFATNSRARMFTNRVDYDLNRYEANSFLDLLEPLGAHRLDNELVSKLIVPEAAYPVAKRLLRPVNQPFLVLFAGASLPEKRWPKGNFRSFIKWCLDKGLAVVMVGAAEDVAINDDIAIDLPVLNLAGRTSLAETAAVLSQASCVVSGDSGVLHMAFGLSRPTVAIFGPSNASKWAPLGKRHISVRAVTACSPCSKYGYIPPCKSRVICLTEISPLKVCQAVADLLGLPV